MEDWRELAQTVIIGLIFSYLVARLISVVVHFKDEQLGIARAAPEPEVTEPPTGSSGTGEEATLLHPVSSSSEEEWEGVESTELDEAFSAATAFVAATAADGRGRVGSEMQLQLYGFYKIATEGPCTAPQPSPLMMTARAKWNAWQKLGAMSPEEAMEKYIAIVTELYPTWSSGSSSTKNLGGTGQASSSSTKGQMGPVFSSLIDAEEPEIDIKFDAIHASARDGHHENMLKLLDDGTHIDLQDGEGRTPLHWAVDRGHSQVVEVLLSRKANVNAKDNEGQTPLHYASLCDRKEIAEVLVNYGADIDIKDEGGNSPNDLCGSAWDFLTPVK